MPTEPISIYNRRQLELYFKANIPRPGWRPWFRAIESIPLTPDAADSAPKLGGLRKALGRLRKAFRSATADARFRFAVYYWLYPFEQEVNLETGLLFILKQAGLDHLKEKQITAAMLQESDRILREHPALTNWIRDRSALLQFLIREERPPQFQRALFHLRNQLIRVVNLLWQDPTTAVELADELIDKALRGAAQVVHAELGGDAPGPLNASLMLPFQEPEAVVDYLAAVDVPARQGKDRADQIWKPLPRAPRTHLVVVAETVGHEHAGFWVPVVDGDRGARVPGAPAAFENHVGSCVFRHDLMELDGFPEDMNARWRTHIRERVRGRHFVSLPFVVDHQEGFGKVALAVLNVNADPPAGDEWYRALHQVWLERARDAAAPFVEIAFYAVLAKFAVLRVSDSTEPGLDISPPDLDISPAVWKRLPGAPVGYGRDLHEQTEAIIRSAQAQLEEDA